MESVARGLLPWLLTAGVVLGQEPDEPEPPRYEGDPFEKVARENKLIDVQWRRDANGDLEWAIAGRKDAEWKRVFGDGPNGVLGPGGIAGHVLPLLHAGDLLSLTDGEAHFRRLGMATDTPALAAFACAPLGKTPSRVDELDRLVAVDVLVARGDAAAKEALARITADEKAPASLRARAAGPAPRRERLTADDLLLPERSDVVIAIDHRRLIDAHGALGLAHLAALLAGAEFVDVLKRPRLADAAIGQAEAESVLEAPFELVRRLGAMRFDHSCVSVAFTGELGGEFTWTAVTAGSFEPQRIAGGLKGLEVDELQVALATDSAVATWAAGGGEVSSRCASARSKGVEAKPRPELASHLLRDGAYSVRVHVPPGSKALGVLSLLSVPKAKSWDLDLTIGDPIVAEQAVTMASEEAATAASEKLATMLERVAEQSGRGDLIEKLGPPKVTVEKDVVRWRLEVPLSRVPGIDAFRKYYLDKVRGG